MKLPRKPQIARNANVSSTNYFNSQKKHDSFAEPQQSQEILQRASRLLKDIKVPSSTSLRGSVDQDENMLQKEVSESSNIKRNNFFH